MELDASKYEWILKSSPEMETFIKHNVEAMEKSMDRANIIWGFQACLNEALKAGREPWYRDWFTAVKLYVDTDSYRAIDPVWVELYQWDDHEYFSLTHLFFWQSWFLNMIERKQDWQFDLMPDSIKIETRWHNNWGLWERYAWQYWKQDKSYHTMMLAAIIQDDVLTVDEARMKYILDNIKWFITKK